MNKQFTPGPWAWIPGNYRHCPGDSCDVRAADGQWIASVHTQFKSIKNGEANARLISHSPEMFALLERIVNGNGDGVYTDAQYLLTKITTP